MLVCERCLRAIESREGSQVTIKHDISLENDDANCNNSICEWCELEGFDVLYELL